MQVPVRNLSGEIVDNIEVSDSVFAVPLNEAVVHQVLVAQQANARQGTASTKTRGEVSGSTRKLYRQKGTGHARAGSIKSPLRRGGGIIFGPKPRDYRQSTPKKMRRLAIRCVLSAKLSDNEMVVLDKFGMEEPRTRQMVNALEALGVGSTALVVTSGVDENVVKSARNIPGVKTMPVNLLNVVDILSFRTLLMTLDAVRQAEELWGESEVAANASI